MAGTGVVSGKDGSITYANGYVAKCSEWTINISVDSVDKTALGDDWRGRLGGIKEWSGSYTTVVDTSESPWGTAGGDNVTDLGIGIAASSATFIFDEPATTDGSFSGNIFITGCTVNATTAGGATTASFDFEGDGALTLTGAA